MGNRPNPTSLKQVTAAALALTRREQIELLRAVENSVYPAVDPALLSESRRRLDDMKSGRVTPVPFAQLLNDLDRLAR
jgi:hypothetical protein